MNANKTQSKRGRGRPRKEIKLPKGNKFTISDIFAANGDLVKCRLTIYTAVKRMVSAKLLKRTSDTVETGKVGKPATIFWKMGAWNARAATIKRNKETAKGRKLAAAPAVELTPPAPAPVADPAPAVETTVPATA